MPGLSIRVICIRFRDFKEKIRLVKACERKGYKVELLDDKFIYGERSSDYEN